MAALQGSQCGLQRAQANYRLSKTPHSRARIVQCRASSSGLTGCRLVGVGSSSPSTVLSNKDLERYIDTNDEWIQTRTGIKRRHILGEGETMAQHAAAASKKALEMAGLEADKIDMILLATSTPDDAFGSACQVRGAAERAARAALDACGACPPGPLGLGWGQGRLRV
jgi:3-oxoacyl-[acyl-carrier-protein] synthase-3